MEIPGRQAFSAPWDGGMRVDVLPCGYARPGGPGVGRSADWVGERRGVWALDRCAIGWAADVKSDRFPRVFGECSLDIEPFASFEAVARAPGSGGQGHEQVRCLPAGPLGYATTSV